MKQTNTDIILFLANETQKTCKKFTGKKNQLLDEKCIWKKIYIIFVVSLHTHRASEHTVKGKKKCVEKMLYFVVYIYFIFSNFLCILFFHVQRAFKHARENGRKK